MSYHVGGGRSVPAALVLRLIRLYQRVSADQVRSRRCRFRPTCSEYAYCAIAKHGLMRGLLLAHRRIARCRPEQPGGDDPVP